MKLERRLEEDLWVKIKELEGEWETLMESKCERNEWGETDLIAVVKIVRMFV